MQLTKCDYCGGIVNPMDAWRLELPTESKDYRPFWMAEGDICRDCLIKVFKTLQGIKEGASTPQDVRIDAQDVADAVRSILLEQIAEDQPKEGGDKP